MTAYRQLLQNNTFENFTATQPDDWQSRTLNNTTRKILDVTDPREHSERATFTHTRRGGDYVFIGPRSWRLDMASATVANDIRQRNPTNAGVGVPVDPGQVYTVTVVARCSVKDNLLRVRIIGAESTPTDTWWLQPTGGAAYSAVAQPQGFEWITTADTNIEVGLQTHWVKYGFNFEIPNNGMESIAVELLNGDTGAQVIDVGEVSIYEQSSMLVGA